MLSLEETLFPSNNLSSIEKCWVESETKGLFIVGVLPNQHNRNRKTHFRVRQDEKNDFLIGLSVAAVRYGRWGRVGGYMVEHLRQFHFSKTFIRMFSFTQTQSKSDRVQFSSNYSSFPFHGVVSSAITGNSLNIHFNSFLAYLRYLLK